MSKDKDEKNDRLSSLDIKLWKAMTKDVTRSKNHDYLDLSEEKTSAGTATKQSTTQPVRETPKAQPSNPNSTASKSLDQRTHTKLRQGKIRPEATLDLHGMTQDEAHNALIQFIKRNYALKKRCVLVITGKGNNAYNRQNNDDHWLHQQDKPGVLKRLTPGWLQSSSLAQFIVQFMPAHPKDGGEGALYVYLHKNKS